MIHCSGLPVSKPTSAFDNNYPANMLILALFFTAFNKKIIFDLAKPKTHTEKEADKFCLIRTSVCLNLIDLNLLF